VRPGDHLRRFETWLAVAFVGVAALAFFIVLHG